MKNKLIAAGVGITLAGIAAVGTFASQDAVSLLEEPTVTEEATLEATETATEEATPTEESTATPTEEATEVPTEEPTSEATETPTEEATEEPSVTPDDGEGRDVGGIPDSNPVKYPDDGDGECEKHETKEKTTPSGRVVNVPCHAADKSNGTDKHGDDEEDEDEVEDESEDE